MSSYWLKGLLLIKSAINTCSISYIQDLAFRKGLVASFNWLYICYQSTDADASIKHDALVLFRYHA